MPDRVEQWIVILTLAIDWLIGEISDALDRVLFGWMDRQS